MSGARITPLRISRGGRGAELSMFHLAQSQTFTVNLESSGFEAFRNLTTDDLREIRDWINTALASVEPHTEGVGE